MIAGLAVVVPYRDHDRLGQILRAREMSRRRATIDYSRDVSWTRELYDAIRRRARAGRWLRSAFNGDGIEQALVKLLVPTLGIDHIVETGTFLGHTTYFLARMFPTLPIDTVEIDGRSIARARRNLRGCANVTIHHQDSARFVAGRSPSYANGNPFFYLDAHWTTDLPLGQELAAIMDLPRAAVIIDDFKVPARPDYAFALEGGTTSSFASCYQGLDIMAIRGALDNESIAAELGRHAHQIQLFPDYRYEEMVRLISRPKFGNLVGYTLLLHGQDATRLDRFLSDPLVQRYFRRVSVAMSKARSLRPE